MWKSLLDLLIAAYKKWVEAKPVPTPVPTPVPVPTPTPVTPPAYGDRVQPPANLKGGECPTPGGLDIRFDVWSPADGDYIFYGNLLAKRVVITRNLDGTYTVTLPDVTVDGYVFRAESYNFPSSASTKIKGNSCPNYNRSGTFRFWINCYKAKI